MRKCGTSGVNNWKIKNNYFVLLYHFKTQSYKALTSQQQYNVSVLSWLPAVEQTEVITTEYVKQTYWIYLAVTFSKYSH